MIPLVDAVLGTYTDGELIDAYGEPRGDHESLRKEIDNLRAEREANRIELFRLTQRIHVQERRLQDFINMAANQPVSSTYVVPPELLSFVK